MGASASVPDADGDITEVGKQAPRISASLTWDGVWGEGFASSRSVTLTVRQSPGGAVLATASKASDPGGYVEFSRYDDYDVDLVAGMQITVGDGTVSKQLTLATITVDSFELDANVVAGSATPDAEVQVNVGDEMGNGTGQATTADGSGLWSVDFSPFDITYAMSANASVRDADGDETVANRRAPRIGANATWDSIWAEGFTSDAEIEFTIRSGATVLASGSKTSDASGYVELYRWNDFDVNLDTGLQITVTDGTVTKVLTIAALRVVSVDPATDVVSGTAPGGAEVQVGVGDNTAWSDRTTTADGSGHWSVDFSPFDVTYTMSASAMVSDADGDMTSVDKHAPRISANLTWDGILADGFAGNAEIDFTIKSGATVLATGSKTSDASGYVELYRPDDFDVDLVPGLTITVGDGAATKELTLAPLAIGSVNPVGEIVSGTAPAGAEVQVNIGDGNQETGRSTTADGSGHWSVDFSPFDVTYGMVANVSVPDSDGDETSADKSPPIIGANLTDDAIWASGFANATSVGFTIRSSGGTVLATGSKTSDASGSVEFRRPGDFAVDLVAGLQITVTDGTSTKQLTLAALAITSIDPATDVVAGTAPAGAEVQVGVGGDQGAGQGTTADGSGHWSVDFSPFDVTETMAVSAMVRDTDADETRVDRPADAIPPETTIESGPAGLTNDSTPSFTFSANEPSTFECRVDGAAFAPCSSPFTTAPLGDGAHTFEVRAIDAAGNLDTTPASRAFTVDTVAPQTTIDSGPSGPTNDSTPTFGFSASETSTFQCRVDGGAFAGCSSPFTTDTLGDGAHTFDVRATDAAGNLDATPASRPLTVDTVAPQTTIDSGPPEVTNDSTPTFTFSSEAGAAFECRVDAVAFAACTSPHTTVALTDGAHTFAVRAVDAAGNPDTSPATRAFTVDTGPPETTIESGPAGLTNDSTPSFTFRADEPSTFECRVDGAAFSPCSSPHTTAALADGAHAFEVRAIDSIGNVDATPAARTFTLHTGSPVTTIVSAPAALTNDATPTFSFSADEAATFQCRLDAGTFATCSVPFTTSRLGDGAHTFEVRAIDMAGNVDSSPARHVFTVHTGPPDTTIVSGPAETTTDATPTFTFSANEPATFQCRVDSAAFAACSSPHTTSSLAIGSHTFEVRAIDTAGNLEQTPASRVFSVATAKASLALLSRSAKVTPSRIAAIKLRCGAAARCQGVLTLSATVRGKLVGSPRSRVKLTLGNQRFSIAAGRTATVKVRLTSRGYRLLLRVKRLPTQARVVYKQPTGGTTTTTRTITLIAARR
jgi:hypothetical protein